ncbi:MAG: PSD1 domain-containing protein, partial [Bryobacteraceae bacterium]|nr:PSD1 domain-containing protein [Bryobacteraceae bacterium]
DSGPAVIPGEPEKSLLLARVVHSDPKKRMPKEGDLVTRTELADLTEWIKSGVAWPSEQMPATYGKTGAFYERLKARHWAFQPVKPVTVPSVKSTAWPQSEIDRFVLAKLEEKNLQPVADAGRLTLIRRLTYDLTGLPPTLADIDRFVKDKSEDAYQRLVDHLLSSPRFGEHWGRHWLDVARYGESSGPSRNVPYPHAWRYREYVIDAVNRDVPFDRFLEEQIAGDLLQASSPDERDRLHIATGFLALGPKDVNQRFKERFQMDNVDEKIDTLTRATLGLTVSCARCHDHKFDPIPATDYYALAGIFTSTQDRTGLRSRMGGAGLDYYDPESLTTTSHVPVVERTAKIRELEAKVASAKKEWEEIRGTAEGLALAANGRPKQLPFRLRHEELKAELLFLTDPGSRGYGIHGVQDAKQIGDTALRIRGEAERLGPVVPRGFLTALSVPDAPAIDKTQSGRVQLASWIRSPNNPLTSRVIVNRVWHHVFGRGIVKTVDNLGANGDRPSHPELLDYLAMDFARNGWSTKRLVRQIVLSRTYRLSSDATAAHREADPANVLLWRHSPRRLSAEEIRDSLLASAGKLQLQPDRIPPDQQLRMVEMRDNGPESRVVYERANDNVSRSVYLPLLRGVVPASLEAFDPVAQSLVTGERESTTVPAQALFILNSPFVRQQSATLAEMLLSTSEPDAPRVARAYRSVLGRRPSAVELKRAQFFLSSYAANFKPRESGSVRSTSPLAAKTSDIPVFRLPIDPDNVDRAEEAPKVQIVEPKTAKHAAWASLVQALYASAEFRFVR